MSVRSARPHERGRLRRPNTVAFSSPRPAQALARAGAASRAALNRSSRPAKQARPVGQDVRVRVMRQDGLELLEGQGRVTRILTFHRRVTPSTWSRGCASFAFTSAAFRRSSGLDLEPRARNQDSFSAVVWSSSSSGRGSEGGVGSSAIARRESVKRACLRVWRRRSEICDAHTADRLFSRPRRSRSGGPSVTRVWIVLFRAKRRFRAPVSRTYRSRRAFTSRATEPRRGYAHTPHTSPITRRDRLSRVFETKYGAIDHACNVRISAKSRGASAYSGAFVFAKRRTASGSASWLGTRRASARSTHASPKGAHAPNRVHANVHVFGRVLLLFERNREGGGIADPVWK